MTPLPAKAGDGTGLFAELFEAHVLKTPDKKIFFKQTAGGWSGLTLMEHHAGIRATLQLFKKLGLRRGDSILIAACNSYEWQLIEHAGLVYGLVIAAVEPFVTEQRTIEIVLKLNIKGVFYDSTWGELTFIKNPVVNTLNPYDIKGLGDFVSQNLENGFKKLSTEVAAEDWATYVFTSGTTGDSRTIRYTHKQLALTIQNLVVDFRPAEHARPPVTICWLPLANLFQRVMNMCCVFSNCEIYYLSKPKQIMDEAARIRPTLLIGVPKFFEMVMLNYLKTIKRFSVFLQPIVKPFVQHILKSKFGGRLEYVISGSAKCPFNVLDFFWHSLHIPIYECYGASENILPISVNTPRKNKINSVGYPMTMNKVRLGEKGEILVAGPGVLKNYFGEMTTELTVDGYYATGDLGYIDDDGFLHVEGRLNDIVKLSSGRKINLTSVERAFWPVLELELVFCLAENRANPLLMAVFRRAPTETDLAQLKVEVVQRNMKLSPIWKVRGVIAVVTSDETFSSLFTANLKFKRNFANIVFQSTINEGYDYLSSGKASATMTSTQGFWFSV